MAEQQAHDHRTPDDPRLELDRPDQPSPADLPDPSATEPPPPGRLARHALDIDRYGPRLLV